MRAVILGADGYIGCALTQWLASKGWVVYAADSSVKRALLAEVNEESGIELEPFATRMEDIRSGYGDPGVGASVVWETFDIMDYHRLTRFLTGARPDVVYHLAHQPAAPYSMRSRDAAVWTHENNALGTLNVLWAIKECCPDAHLVAIGTMGEYGTPDCVIQEPPLRLYVEDGNRVKSVGFRHFPRMPSSYYHSAKVAMTHDIECACRFWGLRATDIMQGVVYGVTIPGMVTPLAFYTGETFGTVVNRFVAQAIAGVPLTIYGEGGQTRGYLPIRDSVRCLELLAEHPAGAGQYRCVNQFAEPWSVVDLAEIVSAEAAEAGLYEVSVTHCENPRIEQEHHFYAPEVKLLPSIGYEPSHDLRADVRDMFAALLPLKDRICRAKASFIPRTRWH